MNKALIGSTGFVGGNLKLSTKFDFEYNRGNIYDIGNHEFDLVVCAAPGAVKWKANQFPEADLAIVNELLENLKYVKTKIFVQISTVDVYQTPIDVDEDFDIETTLDTLHPYGKHRYLIERFVKKNFRDYLIIRLPGLFGIGLKKNVIFDLMNNNLLEMIHKDSVFQFYYLKRLWRDIKRAMKKNVKILNITSEPISVEELARVAFKMNFKNVTEKPPVKYNLKSKFDKEFGGNNGYLYTKNIVLSDLFKFLEICNK